MNFLLYLRIYITFRQEAMPSTLTTVIIWTTAVGTPGNTLPLESGMEPPFQQPQQQATQGESSHKATILLHLQTTVVKRQQKAASMDSESHRGRITTIATSEKICCGC